MYRHLWLLPVCWDRANLFQAQFFQTDTVRERPSAIPSMTFTLTVVKVAGWGRDDPAFAEPHCSLLSWTLAPVIQLALWVSKPWKNQQSCSG